MEVIACRPAGGANVADELTTLDILSLTYHEVGHMTVEGREAVEMVDHDIIAPGVIINRSCDLATLGRIDLGSLSRSQVHTVMEMVLAGDRV